LLLLALEALQKALLRLLVHALLAWLVLVRVLHLAVSVLVHSTLIRACLLERLQVRVSLLLLLRLVLLLLLILPRHLLHKATVSYPWVLA
jgi:hypothetical protein